MTEPKASLRERTEQAATDAWIGPDDDYDELIQRCEPEDIEGFMTIALRGPPIEFLIKQIEMALAGFDQDYSTPDSAAASGVPIDSQTTLLEALKEIRKARGEK